MKRSAFVSDVAFAFVIVALPVLCYLRSLRLPLAIAGICAALLGCAAAIGTAARLKRKDGKLRLRAKERLEAEKLALHLSMLSIEERITFFTERFSYLFDGEEQGRAVERRGAYFLEGKQVTALCKFQLAPLSSDDTLPLLCESGERSFAIVCNELTQDAEEFLRRFDVKIVSIADIYADLKKADALPERYLGERAFEQKRKRKSAIYFARSNSRRCLVGGVMLLLSSLIVPFPFYYSIFGGILMICALLLRLYGVKN